MPCPGYGLITYLLHLTLTLTLRPVMTLPEDVYDRLSDIHNTLRGHVGLKLCRFRFNKVRKQRIEAGLPPEDAIPDHMISSMPLLSDYQSITATYQGS